MMNQEAFDKVATHLLTQNKRSVSLDEQTCLYRSPDGLKCAIGCLISDEDYLPEMDDEDSPLSVNGLISTLYKFHSIPSIQKLNTLDNEFLNELQTMHDFTPTTDWKNELLKISKSYNLNARVLNQFY